MQAPINADRGYDAETMQRSINVDEAYEPVLPNRANSDLELRSDVYGGDTINLASYEIKNRNIEHFRLAVKKNFQLKLRKRSGLCCEIVTAPLFMVILIIGYYQSENAFMPMDNFAHRQRFNATEVILDEMMCVAGVPENYTAPFHIKTCPFNRICVLPLGHPVPPNNTYPPGWSPYAQVCMQPHNEGETRNFMRRCIDAGVAQPEAIPDFDAFVFLQKLVHDLIGPLRVNTDSYWHSLTHMGNLEFVGTASASCEDVRDLQRYLRETTFFFDTLFDFSVDRGNPACPEMWPSEKAAVDYVVGKGADTTWGIIVLNNVNFDRQIFDYTLRMNYTATPYTFDTTDKFHPGLGKHRYQQYINSGFPTLQTKLNAYFMDAVGQRRLADIVSVPMPIKSFFKSQFFTTAGFMIPLVQAMSFLYPVSCLVGGIVEEKEQRLREGMLIMGLSKTSFYASWYFTYVVLTTMSCLLITALSASTYLSKTSAFLIFIVFECYALSVISMGMLMSVFFSKSRIAAIASPCLMFIAVVPKFALPANEPRSVELWTSILSPVAFGYSADLMTNYESADTGSGFANFFDDDYSYAFSVMMMLADSVLYLVLAWYLDQVLPSEFGVKKHPLFFTKPGYWFPARYPIEPVVNTERPTRMPKYVDTDYSEDNRDDMQSRERVRISGLRKVFKVAGENTIAVNNLGNGLPAGAPGGAALTFYEGQIQCVLGHNGAGKTTLINLLTGMLTPSGGDCTVWGRSIVNEMEKIRESIGFCPQHNILWPRMTVEEHLDFFGKIKGVPHEVLHGANGRSGRVEKMLKMVNLYEKRNVWSSVLSGGQKRKLSVACALVGGAKLVFLDEPTAGMDVESRRAMWSLLRDPAVLKGRVIVLTTHYMDEADLLGDSIAIMHKGCLHSWGSSFFLKSRLGVGYNMSIAMRKGCDPMDVENLIRSHITRADVSRISCTGNELRIRLPIDCSPTRQSLQAIRALPDSDAKLQLDNAARKTPAALREYLENLAKAADPPTHEMQQVISRLQVDLRTESLFPALFDSLDRSKSALRVEGYGVSVTTLEEIFFKIAHHADEEQDYLAAERSTEAKARHWFKKFVRNQKKKARAAKKPAAGRVAYGCPQPDEDEALCGGAPGGNSFAVTVSSIDSPSPSASPVNPSFLSLTNDSQLGTPQSTLNFGSLYSIVGTKKTEDAPRKGAQLYLSQFKSLVVKRFHCARRDNRTLCFQFVLPAMFIMLALLLGNLGPPSQPLLVMDGQTYNYSQLAYSSFSEPPTGFFASCFDGCDFRSDTYKMVDVAQEAPGVGNSSSLADWLLDTFDLHEKHDRAVAFTYPDVPSAGDLPVSTLFSNATLIHSVPIGLDAFWNAMLRYQNPNASTARIITKNHPLPFSRHEQKVIDSALVIVTGIFIMIPFTFIPSNFVSFIVKERECKAKHVQVVSGVHIAAYWISNFAFDLMAYGTTMFIAFVVFLGDDRTEFIGDWPTAAASLLLFLLYGVSSISNSYFMSFVFNSHTAAQNAVMIFNFVAGFILVIAAQIMDLIVTTRHTNHYLKYIYRLVPSYCLGEGIIEMSARQVRVELGQETHIQHPFAWSVTGVDLVYMAAVTPIFFFLMLLIEAPRLRKFFVKGGWAQPRFWRQKLRSITSCKRASKNMECSVNEEGEALVAEEAYEQEDGKLDTDGDNVLSRKGAWLACQDAVSEPVYYFNELTGLSKWSNKDTPFFCDKAVSEHAREVLDPAVNAGMGRPGDYVTVQRLRK
eukprot:gene19733-30410_t